MIVTWIGPAGHNPEVGKVFPGKQVELFGAKLERFLGLGLVKKQSKKKGD